MKAFSHIKIFRQLFLIGVLSFFGFVLNLLIKDDSVSPLDHLKNKVIPTVHAEDPGGSAVGSNAGGCEACSSAAACGSGCGSGSGGTSGGCV